MPVASEFFRFPHTPHIAWLGGGRPRDDKVMSPDEANGLLAGEVIVEEKVDGANLGISVSSEGEFRVQNRGQYLVPPYRHQHQKLSSWLKVRADALFDALGEDLILFGEWCAARHSVPYDRLPDWFLVFDVYDRAAERFWSTARRNSLATRLALAVVPTVLRGRVEMERLRKLVADQPSAFREGPVEGIVVRCETGNWLDARAKLVRPQFTQAITEHWSRGAIEWNRLAPFRQEESRCS